MSDIESLEAQREKMNVFITLATTALQHHRVDEPSKLERHDDNILRILQRVTTLLTTGTPGNLPRPTNDHNVSRVVAVTANVRNDSIRTLLVTANTKQVSPGSEMETRIEPLGRKRAGEDVLRNWRERECVLSSPLIAFHVLTFAIRP